MNDKILTPVIDINGNQTSRWMSLTKPSEGSPRVASMASPVPSLPVQSDAQLADEMEDSLRDINDVGDEVKEEIDTAINAVRSGDRFSAWWALDRATQLSGYDDRDVSSFVDAYRDMLGEGDQPPAYKS